MPKKSSATAVATAIALGLSLIVSAPAFALDAPPPGDEVTAPAEGGDSQPTEPAPSPSAASAPEAQAPEPQALVAPAPSVVARSQSSYPAELFGVALYVYKLIDPSAPPSWENSGPQTLVLSDVDNTSADGNEWFTSFHPGFLPEEVCGTGWAVQQDKVKFTGSYAFPETIVPPDVITIGWPPLYDAKHEPLELYTDVPPCDPQVECEASNPSYPSYPTDPACTEIEAQPTTTPPSCTAPGSYSLPLVDHVSWLRDGSPVAPGDYDAPAGTTVTITAVAAPGWKLTGGELDPETSTWTLTWPLDFPKPECVEPQLVGSLTALCRDDVPILSYSVTLLDPDSQSTGSEAVLSLTDGVNTYVFDPILGNLSHGETLTGERLWPGATVAPDGTPTGWPGWEFDGTDWVPTAGNFAWSRADGVTAIISVNPELMASVTYPPGSPECVPGPRDTPTLGLFPTSATLAPHCTADGGALLTLGLVGGVSFFDDVTYLIDGVPAARSTVELPPGSYLVRAVVKNAGDGLDGPTQWRLTVTGGPACGELSTLALTGAQVGLPLVAAVMLLATGAGILLYRRARPQRAE